MYLTRYHGVFAANATLRAAITPAGRGSKARSRTPERPAPKHVALNWARRLKRVFGIEIEQCARCGGRLEVIASIEEPELIERILALGAPYNDVIQIGPTGGAGDARASGSGSPGQTPAHS